MYAVLELPAMSFPNDVSTVPPLSTEFMWLFEVILYLTHETSSKFVLYIFCSKLL